ncbi:hypothetical protein DIPPA_34551 [Diplonema papillatum]|nr:hypothetical protein DIPPA_34551 [Diplonema papillatum]
MSSTSLKKSSDRTAARSRACAGAGRSESACSTKPPTLTGFENCPGTRSGPTPPWPHAG